ncbi:MAG TPA: response regulator transcription factor [Gaiellaceae bacterium]|jgi:two-component system, NarL family, invasion response regulator UvrY|nr:response regulator transcription factor [Gaiellaceae bacterium]
MTVRVLVADDQPPFRAAARAVVGATPEFELVGEARSGEEAVALVGALRPDVVLMDINMAGLGGIEATRSIAGSYPETMTILLSTYREEDLPPQARACGAIAYLHKSNLDGKVLRRLWARRHPSSAR